MDFSSDNLFSQQPNDIWVKENVTNVINPVKTETGGGLLDSTGMPNVLAGAPNNKNPVLDEIIIQPPNLSYDACNFTYIWIIVLIVIILTLIIVIVIQVFKPKKPVECIKVTDAKKMPKAGGMSNIPASIDDLSFFNRS
ncbi:hypothetical protein DLEV_124 [Diachasmimorpha longicaudata entomopoxvirus]|uniref:Uncharacterized protein n=1 Tax=Diachasmimorpha longicaudata entomopoxvirus TaxID=109981 RepID=A0A7R5WFC1_9POXV|nr:hypothetical protein QKK69_gp124 [Diachasmimorpha longicaudata entomopoxvirus]AKS26415.1 hypothetical protein DLEV_124 [Diachasmimorpha longicaudata entomopoxvirus]